MKLHVGCGQEIYPDIHFDIRKLVNHIDLLALLTICRSSKALPSTRYKPAIYWYVLISITLTNYLENGI